MGRRRGVLAGGLSTLRERVSVLRRLAWHHVMVMVTELSMEAGGRQAVVFRSCASSVTFLQVRTGANFTELPTCSKLCNRDRAQLE